MNKEYLAGAKEEMKRIYESLGHSPTSAEYNKNAATIYNLKRLKKQNILLNTLKEAAKIPLRRSGINAATKINASQKLIYCLAYGGEIISADCMPGYKKEICKNCKSKQEKNVKALPDIPDQLKSYPSFN